MQAMEQAQSNMVPVDVLGQAEAAAEAAKTDLKRLEGNHRQLLVRYTTVKSVIDAAYKKWEKHSAESFGMQKHSSCSSIRTKNIVL